MPKFHVVAKITSEVGILVDAETAEEAEEIAESLDVDIWTPIDGDFEITHVGLWDEPR